MSAANFQKHNSRLPQTNAAASLTALGALFQRIESCLLQYAVQCDPWIPSEQVKDSETLQIIARWQRESLKPLVEILDRRGWHVEPCRFPAEFASLNDVSFSYLLGKVAEDQAQLVAECVSLRRSFSEDADLRVCLNRLLGEQRLILAEVRNLAVGDRQALHEQFAEAPMASLSHLEKPTPGTHKTTVQVSA